MSACAGIGFARRQEPWPKTTWVAWTRPLPDVLGSHERRPLPMARQKQGSQRENEKNQNQTCPHCVLLLGRLIPGMDTDVAGGEGQFGPLQGRVDSELPWGSWRPPPLGPRLARRLRQLFWSHTMNVIPVVEALPVCPACDSSHPNRRRTPQSGCTLGRVSGSGAPERLHSLPQGHAFYRPDLQGPLPLECL